MLIFAQQSVAPFNRSAQRLVTAQCNARACSQHSKAIIQSSPHAVHTEQRHARRGEFNGERIAGMAWPVADNAVTLLELSH